MTGASSEGLKSARLLMVIASLSPLFLLLPLKYEDICKGFKSYEIVESMCQKDPHGIIVYISFVLIFIILPHVALIIRKKQAVQDTDLLKIKSAEDRREHLLAYLFAVFLPLYQTDASSFPKLIALVISICFIIWIFFKLNIYYVNPYFTFRGYHIFLVRTQYTGVAGEDPRPAILLTLKSTIKPDDEIRAMRLSATVYIDDTP